MLKIIKDVKMYMLRLRWSFRLLLYIITIILIIATLLVVIAGDFQEILTDIIYVVSAGAVGLSAFYLYHDLSFGINDKLRVSIERNPFANRLMKDYRYRTVSFTYLSFSFNLLFALNNSIFGIIYHSVWFGTLSAYYIVLSTMRFIVIQYARKHSKVERTTKMIHNELTMFQICGILFILLTLALGISVIQMVYYNKGYSYAGMLIFAVAAYTFYKISIAIFNIVKAGRLKSPLLLTIRNIGYADATVSVLSLQAAMFVSFGTGDKVNERMMDSITGGAVCLMIASMGIYMIYSGYMQKKNIR